MQRSMLATLALVAMAVMPAAAQQAGLLPPGEIINIVRDAGLDPLGPPSRRGGAQYVVRAIGDADREVNVVVDGRSGGIVSISPATTASRQPPSGAPRGGALPGPAYGTYERLPPGAMPGDIVDEPGIASAAPPPVLYGRPGLYRMGPPIVVEEEPPMVYGSRPPANVPSAPTVIYGTRPPANVPGAPPVVYGSRPPADMQDAPPPRGGVAPWIRGGAPPAIAATPRDELDTDAPGGTGMLPPPPERFPQRLAPPSEVKPKPQKKTVASAPKAAPLPKPRPADSGAAAAPAPAANVPAKSGGDDVVPPAAPDKKSDVPH
jgi:hypothetical protein